MLGSNMTTDLARFAIGFDHRDRRRLYELWDRIFDAERWSEGTLTVEFEEAWGRLRRFLRFIGTSENYVSVVKLATQLRGLDVGDVRRPYLMPQEDEREALVEELRQIDAVLTRA